MWLEATQAGKEAGNAVAVVPMIVGTAIGFSNKIDHSKPTEYVADGVCGFAWITVKPATSKFARWLKEKDLARRDSYEGGVSFSIHDYNQSMQRKEAHAHAMAAVLREHFQGQGLRIYSQSRMD